MILHTNEGHKKLLVTMRRTRTTGILCKIQMAHKWSILAVLLTLYYSACAKKEYPLSNKHLKIAYYEWDPMFKIHKNPDGTVKYSGILGNLVVLMQQKRNITFTLIEEPNAMWGNCEGSNNCSGMIGMVNRKEADFALGMYISVKRYPILAYTYFIILTVLQAHIQYPLTGYKVWISQTP